MEKLAAEAGCFTKLFVERKITVLIVQHNRVTISGEMQTDLMHPAGFDVDTNEGRFQESLGDRKARPRAHWFAIPAREGKIDDSFILLQASYQQTYVLFFHLVVCEDFFELTRGQGVFGCQQHARRIFIQAVNQPGSHSLRAILNFQYPQDGLPLEDAFALVNGNARGLVNDDERIVLKNNFQVVLRRDGSASRFHVPVEWDVEFKMIAGADEVIRLATSSVNPHAVFTKELPDVTHGKPFLEKVLQFFRIFAGPYGDFLYHAYQITGSALSGQEYHRAIFAIL